MGNTGVRRLIVVGAALAGMLSIAAAQPSSDGLDSGVALRTPTPSLMQWSDLLSRPKARPQFRIPYGAGPQQFGELWIPDGGGRHPVIALIHGGCWTAAIADLSIMDYVAEDLRKRGIAVWNIEYRSVDQPGGGYPGTYQDVAAALDLLPKIGRAHRLTLGRLVVVGHSAGGHLALWAAARPRLSKTSVLSVRQPVKIGAVVDIAGIPNLETDTATACGAAPIVLMTGQPTPERPDIYADTSPATLVPLHVPQWVIHGAQDHTVKPTIGDAYAARARAADDTVTVLNPPGGHVEEISPGTPAWSTIADVIVALTVRPRRTRR